MSETHLWQFSFKGRGLPSAAAEYLMRLRRNEGTAEQTAPEAVAPGASEAVRRLLAPILSVCADGGLSGISPLSSAGWFSLDFSGALHDDLAIQSFDVFFPWLCQYASEDQFFGLASVLGAMRPTFLYAIDRKFAAVEFERGDFGRLAGPFGAAAIADRLAVAPKPSFPLAPVSIDVPAHKADARLYGWEDVNAVIR